MSLLYCKHFPWFSLNCNGLCVIQMQIFKVELKTSHGILLASLMLACYYVAIRTVSLLVLMQLDVSSKVVMVC